MSAPDAEVPEPEASSGSERARLDMEAVFAEIVAHFDDPPAPGAPGAHDDGETPGPEAGAARRVVGAVEPPPQRPLRPDRRNVGGATDPTDGGAHRAHGAHGTGRAHGAGRADGADGAHAAHGTEDTDERWEPPALPPFRRSSWRTALPWAAVGGAAAFFLVVVLAHLVLPGLVLLAGVLVFAAGFITLVLRLPSRRDGDDDGAVL